MVGTKVDVASSAHVDPIMSFKTLSGESAHLPGLAAAVPLLNEPKPRDGESQSGSMGGRSSGSAVLAMKNKFESANVTVKELRLTASRSAGW